MVWGFEPLVLVGRGTTGKVTGRYSAKSELGFGNGPGSTTRGCKKCCDLPCAVRFVEIARLAVFGGVCMPYRGAGSLPNSYPPIVDVRRPPFKTCFLLKGACAPCSMFGRRGQMKALTNDSRRHHPILNYEVKIPVVICMCQFGWHAKATHHQRHETRIVPYQKQQLFCFTGANWASPLEPLASMLGGKICGCQP